MASRKLEDLTPSLQLLAAQLITECKKIQIDLLITCTYRSNVEQLDLYARGRTRRGKILTYAPPGQSGHNHTESGKPAALAFDVVPIVHGKPLWDTEGVWRSTWLTVGGIGEALGLEWAGRWPALKREFAHFQLPRETWLK